MTLALSATGHAAMDCVMNNMVERGDVVLIAENGIWGERAGDMASRHGEESSLTYLHSPDFLSGSSGTYLQQDSHSPFKAYQVNFSRCTFCS